MKEKETKRLIISLDIETNKDYEAITKALERGIYRGLDTTPYYIAAPKDVKIHYCGKRF